jgi:carboxypeptidase Q
MTRFAESRSVRRQIPLGLNVNVTALAAATLLAATPSVTRAQQTREQVDASTIERIKSEEMQHSQVMDIMSWLSDVYGPRLTWSPNLIRAGDWAMGQMRSWGLSNVHEEKWDTPAGLGWENEHFSLMAKSPVPFIVEAVPQAWSVRTKGTVTGPAVLVHAGCRDELEQQYAGKLKNGFVLASPPVDRPVNAFNATATRYSDSALTVMENATPNAGGRGGRGAFGGPAQQLSEVCRAEASRDSAAAARAGRGGGRGGFGGGRGGLNMGDTTTLRWLANQGVAAVLLGDVAHVGGDIGTNNGASRDMAAPHVPTVHVAQESYGRIARILEKKVPVTLELNMENRFIPANTSSFNVIGEIPGTDPKLKDEVVMIGAHFDSWHSGTGATDNGAGSGVMLEAMRLLQSLHLQPRRTIRIALWTGEEQGLLGSRAYVAQHFGVTDSTGLHAKPEQRKLAAYFNVDNGSGKIRGVYLQGIEAERPIFDAWMAPFRDLGMKTLTINNTGGTDHLSYIAVGLPGFQFIQDPLDYGNVTHHTNQDVYERLQPDDMKFNAAVVASFAWQAAQRDDMLPRPAMATQAGRGGGRSR